jgi:hypothetical protein
MSTPITAPKKHSEGVGKTSEGILARPEVYDVGFGTYYKGN